MVLSRSRVSRSAALVFILFAGACSGGSNIGGSVIPPTSAAPNGGAGATSNVTMSEFPLEGDTDPVAITVAPDGNAWFLSLAHVNRITPGGTISSFIGATTLGGEAPSLAVYSPANDITIGPDGAVWFTADPPVLFMSPLQCGNLCNVLARIPSNATPGTLAEPVVNLDNAQFEESPTGLPSTGVVSGPNHDVWVESCGGHGGTLDCPGGQYLAVQTSGHVDIFGTLPYFDGPVQPPQCTAGSGMCGYDGTSITQGSDGAIYIAATLLSSGIIPFLPPASAVFRIDATGKITNMFLVPDATRIANGPDGNLWITQAGTTNAIARMTTSGVLTEFPLPTKDAQPLGIAQGNDGAVWFTEFKASKVARITTGGVITEFPTPTANAGPSGIASLLGECGSGHGRIWFTEATANKIALISF